MRWRRAGKLGAAGQHDPHHIDARGGRHLVKTAVHERTRLVLRHRAKIHSIQACAVAYAAMCHAIALPKLVALKKQVGTLQHS
jgi:hypothetical protein